VSQHHNYLLLFQSKFFNLTSQYQNNGGWA